MCAHLCDSVLFTRVRALFQYLTPSLFHPSRDCCQARCCCLPSYVCVYEAHLFLLTVRATAAARPYPASVQEKPCSGPLSCASANLVYTEMMISWTGRICCTHLSCSLCTSQLLSHHSSVQNQPDCSRDFLVHFYTLVVTFSNPVTAVPLK